MAQCVLDTSRRPTRIIFSCDAARRRHELHLLKCEALGFWNEKIDIDITESEHAEEYEQDQWANAGSARISGAKHCCYDI
jgi:hypothetical protein